MKIQAVIFDMDGLMFDTERVSAAAWKKAGELTGYEFPETFLVKIRGKNHGGIKPLFFEWFGNDFPFDKIRVLHRQFYQIELKKNGLVAKEGLYELLNYLKRNQKKIILATSAGKESATFYLKMAKVSHYFDYAVFGNMVANSKPDPEIFLKAAKQAKEQPINCLVLEDSPNGVQAALNGGFPVIMVPDIAQPDMDLRNKVMAVCPNLNKVICYLQTAFEKEKDR